MSPRASELRDFYAQVIGWSAEDFDMGGYSDYNMLAPDGEGAAGICHPMKDAPAEAIGKWMVYFVVEDVEAASKRCEELGGRIIMPIVHGEGYGRWCFIADPTGAVCALFTRQ